MMPKTSLLISHFNDPSGLTKCIESILSCSDYDFEIVIYDDGSEDDAKNQLLDISKSDKRIRCIFGESNRGCGFGFDRLSKEAVGDIIHYVGADDLVHPRRIPDALEFHTANKYSQYPEQRVPLLATGFRHLNHFYKLLPREKKKRYCHEEIKSLMFFFTPIVHGTISIPRLAYENLVPFSQNRRAGVDYLFFCQNNDAFQYSYVDRNRYYVRLKQKSLTRTPKTRIEQLHSHDLGMQYLWSKIIGCIDIENITLIRRILISRDDCINDEPAVSPNQSKILLELLDRCKHATRGSFYLTKMFDSAKQRIVECRQSFSGLP